MTRAAVPYNQPLLLVYIGYTTVKKPSRLWCIVAGGQS